MIKRVDDLLILSEVVDRFMRVPRATMREGRGETDGEHTLHLQFLAVAYAQTYHPELDVGKVSVYALVHDFIEVYAGDVNSLVATAEEMSAKALTEKIAFDRLKKELGQMWPAFIDHILEYESLETPEARFVKCFDKCDPSISHYRNGGAALFKMGVVTRDQYERLGQHAKSRMEMYASEFPDVVEIRDELRRRVTDAAYPNDV